MTINDLIKIYEIKKKQYGQQAYRHISNVLKEAKSQHKRDFTGDDHEQSWRAFKGKNLEKMIEYIITDEVLALGLKVVNGNILEKTNGANLSKELSLVKRDLIIFNSKTSKIVAVLSSKVTLRERIAQTGYWKIKLSSDEAKKHIKVYFV